MNLQRNAACPSFRRLQRMTRRSALKAGWLGALATTVGQQAWGADSDAAAGFGSAKRCIFIFMWGGPSHLDTWDMKPEAPAEIRGEFKPIATSVPGIQISEHFPRLAQLAHRYAVIRSMTHDDPAHLSSAHHLLTGRYAPRRISDADPPSRQDSPQIGSVLGRLRPPPCALPGAVTLPWIVSHPAAPGGRAPGQNAGWMGTAFDPLVVGDPNIAGFRPPGIDLPAELPADRLLARQKLLTSLDRPSGSNPWDDLSQQAFRMLTSPTVRRAFRLEEEPAPVRDRYGRNTHGQCLLLARRLIETGVPMVTVNWHDDGQAFWDTHGDNFRSLRERLMPPADLGFSALLEDLADRGLLDDTLVIWAGEFGRNPRITAANAGREHWPRCFSAVLAGGGIHGGRTYGSSDRIGAFPAENPTSPSDLAATIYHALGIRPEHTIVDRLGIPKALVEGRPITSLFA